MGTMESLAKMMDPSDGCGYLLGDLNAKINMTTVVHNSHESLEPGPLTTSSLLLHWHDL